MLHNEQKMKEIKDFETLINQFKLEVIQKTKFSKQEYHDNL